MHTGNETPDSDFIEKPVPPHRDPHLGMLRAQIKKVMIPLLIKIFELKLAAQQANTPPSRLQKQNTESTEQILGELNSLEEDLKLLQLWCLSCQKQIERAYQEVAPKITTTRYTQTTSENTQDQQSSGNWLRKFLKK